MKSTKFRRTTTSKLERKELILKASTLIPTHNIFKFSLNTRTQELKVAPQNQGNN
jgi:hypothetical protein